jgi:tetratricopeptide (TPR) repeat protein
MSDSTQLKQLRRLRDKAALCLEEDRFKEAEEALTQAVALARQSDNDDNLAATLYEFGRCFWAQRMFKEAEPPLKQALEFQRDRSDARADTLLLLGSCALCEQSIEDAENWLREGVDIQAALYQDTDPRLAFGLHELGVCLTYKGEYEKSKDVLLRAVVLQSDMPQRKLPTSHELAVCLTLLGQYHDAELHFRQSLKARSVRPGITRIALAGCLIEQFKLNQAEKELDQAMTVVSDTDCCARAYGWIIAKLDACSVLSDVHVGTVCSICSDGFMLPAS